MYIDFYNPPSAIHASGSKEGVQLGGAKTLITIDSDHNLFSIGNIYTEMSWATFYKEAGIETELEDFKLEELSSVREDPEALTNTIIDALRQIRREKKLFYGIMDLEVDAFMKLTTATVIPGLTVETDFINNLMDAHKQIRDKNLFPNLVNTESGIKKILISFQGTNKHKVYYYDANSIEDLAQKLLMAKGYVTGIVMASTKAAYFFLMYDKIVFRKKEKAIFSKDEKTFEVISKGLKNNDLFPISWFRIDLGTRSLETLKLWDEIKDDPVLKKELDIYDGYVTAFIVNKYKDFVKTKTEAAAKNLDELDEKETKQALKDMAKAIKLLAKEYKKE